MRDKECEGGRERGVRKTGQIDCNENVCWKSFIFMILKILKSESAALVAILKRPHLWLLDRALRELRSASAKGQCARDN